MNFYLDEETSKAKCELKTRTQTKTFDFPLYALQADKTIFEIRIWPRYMTTEPDPNITGGTGAVLIEIISVYFKRSPTGDLIYFAGNSRDLNTITYKEVMQRLDSSRHQALNAFDLSVLQNLHKRAMVESNQSEQSREYLVRHGTVDRESEEAVYSFDSCGTCSYLYNNIKTA